MIGMDECYSTQELGHDLSSCFFHINQFLFLSVSLSVPLVVLSVSLDLCRHISLSLVLSGVGTFRIQRRVQGQVRADRVLSFLASVPGILPQNAQLDFQHMVVLKYYHTHGYITLIEAAQI